MKQLIFCLILICSLLSACEKNLDIVPKDNQTTASFYKTAEDAEAAVTAAYGALTGDLYGVESMLTPTCVTADEGIPFLTGNADRRALWSYNISSSNTWVYQPWALGYIAIQRCNIAIGRIPGISMDENLKKRLIAEAKFIRAMMYFNLVRFYGGVPLVVTETLSASDNNTARSGEAEIYALIEEDLKEGELILPVSYSGTNIGRATQGAAKGLLAKVYLTQAGHDSGSPFWAKAAEKAKEVIDLGVYDLWNDYSDVYDMKNRGGKESLFEIMYLTDVAGNAHPSYWTPRGDPRVPYSGFGTIRPTKSLYDLFAPNDKRRNVTFLHFYVDPNTGDTVHLDISNPDPAHAISFDKYTDLTSKIYGGGGKSFPYLRFSDVLLMYAEALNEMNGPTSEAYAAINRVRERAGITPLKNLSKDQFRDAVLNERRVELAFEANRQFDLVRTGRLIEAVKAETSFGRNPIIQPFNILFPIPQREIDANPLLEQNPGY